MGVLALAGLAQSFTMVTMSMLLLSVTSPEIRGRVMGLRSLAVYGLPLGLLASGFLAEILGASLALVVNGAVGIVFGDYDSGGDAGGMALLKGCASRDL